MNIPSDVKAYVKRSILMRVVKWLAATVAIVVLLILTNGSFEVANTGVKAFIYTTLILVPFFAFRIPLLIIDTTWQGTITKIYNDYGMENGNKAFPTYEAAMRTTTVSAIVTLTDGSTRTVVLYSGRLDKSIADMLNKYETGNRVVHIRGTKHYQVVSQVSISCVVCGHINKRSNKYCSACCHTLDLFNG